MTEKLTHRLTAPDAAFLYFERPNAPLHIGSLGIYQGQVSFQRFLEHMDSRMPNIPRYRQRLAFVPLGLSHPTWEDDPAFDIRNHVFHVDLPAPGNDQQLREVTAEIFAKALDRDKPLWESYVINGIEGDRSAILSKVHHCLVDGVSGIELLMAIVDLTPEPAPPPEASPWEPARLPAAPTRIEGAFWDQVDRSLGAFQEFVQGMIDPQAQWKRTQDLMRAFTLASPYLTRPATRLPFSVTIGPERHLGFSEMSFIEIREIRTSLGGTVNDVVLTVLAGALRRYLLQHGHQVDNLEVRVAVPVNVRLEGEQGALGNRVSMMLTSLPLGEPDAAKRYAAIQTHVNSLKEGHQAAGLEMLSRLGSLTPAPLQAMFGMLPSANTMVNMICTNVPGPMIPLYAVGQLLLEHYPLVPLSLGMGLGIGVTSYNHHLFFGLTADPKAVPDIDFLKQCVDESFLELRDAAGVSASDVPVFAGNHKPAAPTAVATA
jgi:WS/DGAT/MGAT family acyltransferase